MHTHKQWWLHCTSQWGQWMPLSEHVYCVAITFKMTQRVEQQICIKFCMKLEHSSAETIRMIQTAATIGNWWLEASSQQHTHSRITSSAQLFGKTSRHPGKSGPPTTQIWCLATSGFSKIKNHLWKERDFRPLMRFRKIWQGSWWQLGKLGEVPRCLLWQVLRHHCPMYNFSCIFLIYF